ncbi:DUF4073 domain-containing protein [Paenibacillus amylolyticus]|uniref:DUF4073 domain-containing protein n=1 Tax=Paenibacillus amylolyticus TaxID=1451 RepID=UPI00201DA38E|nr:DUF4073 domain-containing protein [Paenibacillus amylolyticus]MCL6660903.1 DUF4073 domain-containing protein [Paenibacillus amylolyticus]
MDISKKLGVAAMATIALTLSTAIHSNVSAASDPYKDVAQASPWAKGLIQEAQDKMFMNGDREGYFHPLQEVTRQEAAVALAKLLGLQLSNNVVSSFSDVAPGSWSESAINAVQKAGWMNGDRNGTFRPKAVITREELASILARATQVDAVAVQEDNLSAIKDNQKISAWAKNSVSSVVSSGLMTGSNGSFHPQKPVLRQELAAILVRMDSKTTSNKLQTIKKIENGMVTIGNTNYSVTEALKPLFSESNVAALANAGVRVETVDGRITKVFELKLLTPGQGAELGKKEFSGNTILDGGQAVIEGNVKVAADYITIKNINISGDLEITKELENDFYAEKITVKGTTYVKGGDDNTVVFDHSSLQGMNITKEDVRVEAVNKTVVKEVHIESKLSGLWGDESITYESVTVGEGVQNASLYAHIQNLEINTGNKETTISGTGHIESVTIKGSGTIALQGTGVIGSVTITDSASQVSLPANGSIQRLVLPDGVAPERVIANYDKVKTQIAMINGASNPAYVLPSSGGGNSSNSEGNAGNSGGGTPSNPGTTPTPTNPNPIAWYPYTYKSYQNRTETSADGLMTTNKTGTVYYMAVRSGDNVRPTTEQVKSGILPNNLPSTHGMFSITANQPVTYKIEGLEPTKAYSMYAIFKNGETGQETQPMLIHSVMNYLANDISVLPYENSNLSQIRIQFTGVLTPPATSTTNPSAIVKDGHLRNYGYGFIEINSIDWDLTIPNMPIMNLNFDPVTLGDGTSYRLDWTYVKDALKIKFTEQNGSPSAHSFGGHGSYSGPEVVSLITKQLSIEAGNTIDPLKGEAVMHILGVYPSPLKQELGLVEFNGQHYQKALVEAGTYSTFADVKQIISAVNTQYPAPSANESNAIKTMNNAVNAANIESTLKRYAAILNIDVSAFDRLNSLARKEIAQSILDQRNVLPESEFSSIQEIKSAYEEAFLAASNIPLNLNFVDTDATPGSVGGDITWTPATDENAVVSYEILWGSNGRSTSSIATVDKNAGNRYSLQSGTFLTSDTTQLFIRALLQDGAYTPSIFIDVKDTLPSAPEKPVLTTDETKNIIIGADASMEFSVDNGTTWIPYDEQDPPVFPGKARVQVRLQADPVNQIPAGKTASLSFSDQVGILIYHNDSTNKFDTMYISSVMEYSSDEGGSWSSYDEVNPPEFPGDLTILLREKGGKYLPAGTAKSFVFTSNVNVKRTGNSLTPLTSTLEYSMDGVDWIEFSRDLVVSLQAGELVQVREAARNLFPAGAATTYNFE